MQSLSALPQRTAIEGDPGAVRQRLAPLWSALRDDRTLPTAIRVKARREQALRRVRILRPCLVAVLSGRKTLLFEQAAEAFEAGEMMALPQGAEIDLRNSPAPGGDYRAFCIAFDLDVIKAVGRDLETKAAPRPDADVGRRRHAVDPHPAILAALEHVLEGAAMRPALAPALLQHRLSELFVALLLHGRCPFFLVPALASPVERIRVLVSLDPRRDWQIEPVARELAIGASTLRRRLRREGTSFRGILEEVRLNLGLALVQMGRTSILEIAHACGYESPSKFAARFRARFGVSPSELRDGG